MNPEGDIRVRLACAEGRVRNVQVTSSRTGLPTRLVRGKGTVEVQRLVPLLFSICNRAQGAASAAAISAAQGTSSGMQESARRTLEVMLENLQESVWRLLIDWPKALDEEALVAPVAVVRHACNTVVDDGVTLDRALAVAESALVEHVYGVPPEAWLNATHVAVLDKWIERGPTLPARLLRRMQVESPGLGRSEVALMPDATFEHLSRALLGEMEVDPEYARFPRWSGMPAETGALARQAATPLIAELLARDGRAASTRFVARLVELALLLRDLRLRSGGRIAPVRGHALTRGTGIGLAETARGLLLHRVQVEGGLVVDYRIVAPTEWNFHPGGALAQGLKGLDASDPVRLEREARTVVQSLDPCVACRVEIADA